MTTLRKSIIKKCEKKLLEMKYRYQMSLASPTSYHNEESEIIDMASREQLVQSSTFFRKRMKDILPELNGALHRIRNGTYGYCELTGEEIESNRLIAVPWTRLSIKAYQMQEAS